MKKTGIFYGSTTGTTKAIAEKLGKMLEVASEDIHDVAKAMPTSVGNYDNLVFGTSTWGCGDLQENWEDFIAGIEVLDLKGKKIAFFGCGDETMTDTFCNGVGELYRRMKATGAETVGNFDADGYTFNHTDALVDGSYIGLLLDEVNHPELTDLRLRQWAGEIADAFNG